LELISLREVWCLFLVCHEDVASRPHFRTSRLTRRRRSIAIKRFDAAAKWKQTQNCGNFFECPRIFLGWELFL
jgi:hypothetical protein